MPRILNDLEQIFEPAHTPFAMAPRNRPIKVRFAAAAGMTTVPVRPRKKIPIAATPERRRKLQIQAEKKPFWQLAPDNTIERLYDPEQEPIDIVPEKTS